MHAKIIDLQEHVSILEHDLWNRGERSMSPEYE